MVPGVWRHGAGGDPPPMPQCVGLSCRFSGRAGRVHAGFTESTRAASYLVPSARVHESGRCTPSPLGAETSRADRLEGVRVFSGTAGTCRVRVRNPGALRGRLGGGVVAYVPRYGAYVTLSQVPREGALFPPHCSPSSLPGRYASAAYTPVCGGTTGNMPRIPAGRVLRYASVCVGMVHL